MIRSITHWPGLSYSRRQAACRVPEVQPRTTHRRAG